MSKHDGGQAFPTDMQRADGSFSHTEPGLTKLEWFAGQALIGVLSNPNFDSSVEMEEIAEHCYEQAVAMLAEREKSNA